MFSNCCPLFWHGKCFVFSLCLQHLTISRCQKGEMKNSKQEKNLEKDRERRYGSIKPPKWCHCSQCGVNKYKIVSSPLIHAGISCSKGPSCQLNTLHICASWFPASCLIGREDGFFSLWSVLWEFVKELIHLEVVWMRSMTTLLFFLGRRHCGGRMNRHMKQFATK